MKKTKWILLAFLALISCKKEAAIVYPLVFSGEAMKFNMKNTSLLVLILLLLISCNKEKDYDYPIIFTGEVTNIDSTGASFNSKIVHFGNSEIIEYGFVWDTKPNPTITNSEKYIIQEYPEMGINNKRISTTLQKDILYYVRAYIKDLKYVTYGINRTFLGSGSKGPIINDIVPAIGNLGDTIIIVGQNFSYIQTNNNVFFDKFKALILKSSQDTLVVIIPKDLNKESSKVEVTILGHKSTSAVEFKLIAPVILDFNPKVATFGSKITIFGTNFSANISTLHVYLGDFEVNISEHSAQYISFFIPENFTSRLCDIKVKMNNLTATSPIKFQLESLTITDFYPKIALTGDTIILTGKNFSPVTTNNKVIFGGLRATVLNSTDNQLTTILPLQNQGFYSARAVEISIEVNGETKTFGETLEINDKWFRKRDCPLTTTWDGLSFVYNGKAYIGLTQSNELLEFDPSTNSWTQMPKFPGTARLFGTGFLINNKIYFGTGLINGIFQHLKDFWEFDLTTKQWTKKSDFIGSERRNATGFSTGTDGYLCGGKIDYSSGGTPLKFNEVWKYNYLIDQWTLVAALPMSPDIGFTYTYNGNPFLCYYVNSNIYCYRFDANNNSWILEINYPETLPGSIFGFVITDDLYYSYLTQENTCSFKKLNLISGQISDISKSLSHSFPLRPVTFTIDNLAYLCQGNSRMIWEFDPTR